MILNLFRRFLRSRPHRQSYRGPVARQAERFESRQLLSAITVTSTADTVNASDGVVTLREALTQANDDTATDTITFDSSLAGQTVFLTSGALQVTQPVSIVGLGARSLTVSGSTLSSIRLSSFFSRDAAVSF